MLSSLGDASAVKPIGNDNFESIHPPERMGNLADIGYGGSTLSVAINAACQTTTTPNFHLYTAMGQYLGPTTTKAKTTCAVRRVRDTRTFATREVQVSQVTERGTRVVLIALLDFHVAEPASVLTYSPAPSQQSSPLAEAVPAKEWNERLVRDGRVTQRTLDLFNAQFEPMQRYVEQRLCPGSVNAQNLSGAAKTAGTTQDGLAIHEKRSAQWMRHRRVLEGAGENVAALAWVLDGGLSFVPLSHNHMFLDDVGACSSLDFALRVFTNEVRFDEWHLHEARTVTGGNGRTFSEAWLWDERGNAVASISQQSIMRAKPARL